MDEDFCEGSVIIIGDRKFLVMMIEYGDKRYLQKRRDKQRITDLRLVEING